MLRGGGAALPIPSLTGNVFCKMSSSHSRLQLYIVRAKCLFKEEKNDILFAALATWCQEYWKAWAVQHAEGMGGKPMSHGSPTSSQEYFQLATQTLSTLWSGEALKICRSFLTDTVKQPPTHLLPLQSEKRFV